MNTTRRGFVGLAASVGAAVAAGSGAMSLLGCSVDVSEEGGTEPIRAAGCVAPCDVPIMAETDVLVVGGGPAGLAAATSAARAGAKTMLVERYGFYGGVITQAIMGSITWYRFAQTVDAGGVCAEIESKAKAMGGSINLVEAVSDPAIRDILIGAAESSGLLVDGKPTYEILRTEMFKAVADALVLDAGVTPLLHSYVVGALMDGPVIEGVITESKSGRQAIRAKRVIDASGDADVAALCGAPFFKPSKDDLMEVSINFSCSNVNINDFVTYVAVQRGHMSDWVEEDCGKEMDMYSTHLFKPFLDAAEAGEIPADVVIKAFPGGFTPEGNVLSLNAVHFYDVDPTDVWDLTRAEMEGRKRVLMALEVLRKRVPGFENAQLSNIGTSVGCRESRKIKGNYHLTEKDVKGEARFEDTIGIFPEFVDAYGILCLPTTGRYFQVPFGITVPQQVENLLVAGRCVAGDRVSHGSTRQMACCMVTGQGAGVAAAVSLQDNVTCREVDIAKVQSVLASQGVRLS
jgi:FAD dependent oxidoreductase